ncbi:MAG: hypothetical protein EOP06_24395 [Proteobacteria bacterium]|nr:MAG: hypothetical protein EOP06_24395 [Pseudomonadota bacterium]
MSQADTAIEFLKENCDFQVVPGTAWNDSDFSRFTELTGLVIPNHLAEVLRRYGQCGTEYNDYFLVEEVGGRSVHNIQVLISNFDIIATNYETFISKSVWENQFTLPMVFFGSADSGHSYLLGDGENPENNAVYFWERATDAFGTGNNSKGITKLADSLPDFFLSLTAFENLEKV